MKPVMLLFPSCGTCYVDFLEVFGVPEALWHLTAQDFIAVVTMDSHGGSLHAEVEAASGKELELLAV